jgi:flagellum-specific ATP synthase
VVDAARAALDGHIVLSRKLANGGHFPAIDVLASVSRVMTDVVTPEHRDLAMTARELLASYRDSADLIEVGAYVAGSNPRVDRAIRCREPLTAFLRQKGTERPSLADALTVLKKAVATPAAPAAAPQQGQQHAGGAGPAAHAAAAFAGAGTAAPQAAGLGRDRV